MCPALRWRYRLRVDVQRRLAVRVAHELLRHLHVLIVVDQPSGDGPAKSVPANCATDSSLRRRDPEMFRDEGICPVRLLPLHSGAGEDPVFGSGVGRFPILERMF